MVGDFLTETPTFSVSEGLRSLATFVLPTSAALDPPWTLILVERFMFIDRTGHTIQSLVPMAVTHP